MQKRNIERAVLFVLFFSIGAATLSGAVLCDELLGYYRNKVLLKRAQITLSRLKTLNADYDVLLEQLKKDPAAIKRIAPATLGTEPADKDSAYPKAAAEQLVAARIALMEEVNRQDKEVKIPAWVKRCSRLPQRTALFLAGAFLVIISFMWFGPTEQTNNSPEQQ